MEESAWFRKCRISKVSGSFPRRGPRKTWNEVTRSDMKERKISKDLPKDKCLEVFSKKRSNLCKIMIMNWSAKT